MIQSTADFFRRRATGDPRQAVPAGDRGSSGTVPRRGIPRGIPRCIDWPRRGPSIPFLGICMSFFKWVFWESHFWIFLILYIYIYFSLVNLLFFWGSFMVWSGDILGHPHAFWDPMTHDPLRARSVRATWWQGAVAEAVYMHLRKIYCNHTFGCVRKRGFTWFNPKYSSTVCREHDDL